MALAWITDIRNHTPYPVYLKQTDPRRNPVIDLVEPASTGRWDVGATLAPTRTDPGKPNVHDWFTIGGNTHVKTSWFVIPWSNQPDPWVRFIIDDKGEAPTTNMLCRCGVQFQVSPDAGGKHDFICFYDRKLNPVSPGGKHGGKNRMPVGPAAVAASTSFRLNITDTTVDFAITESNSAGADFLSVFTEIGRLIALTARISRQAD